MTNSIFADHVTSQAFALTLSRPMIEELRRVEKDCDRDGFAFSGGQTMAVRALERRGLVVWTMRKVTSLKAEYRKHNEGTVLEGYMPYRDDATLPVANITYCGRLVLELARQAGLTPEVSKPDKVFETWERKQLQHAKQMQKEAKGVHPEPGTKR